MGGQVGNGPPEGGLFLVHDPPAGGRVRPLADNTNAYGGVNFHTSGVRWKNLLSTGFHRKKGSTN